MCNEKSTRFTDNMKKISFLKNNLHVYWDAECSLWVLERIPLLRGQEPVVLFSTMFFEQAIEQMVRRAGE